MTHRVNDNEMDPKTECGLDVDVVEMVPFNEEPSCLECAAMYYGEAFLSILGI